MIPRRMTHWAPNSVSNLETIAFDLHLIVVPGLRQKYRWNYLGACAYVTEGGGICNSTTFGYPFTPLAAILSDTPAKFAVQ
jgi:hypothetical protein